MVEDLSESQEPVWLMTWDQLERYGPLPVRLALREMPRRTGGNEPVPLLRAHLDESQSMTREGFR